MFQQTFNAMVRRGCILFPLLPLHQQLSWYICHSSHAQAFHNFLCHTWKCFLPSYSIWNLSVNIEVLLKYSSRYLFYENNNLFSENILWCRQCKFCPKWSCFRGVVSMLFPPSLSFQLHSYNILTGETSSSKVSRPPVCCWSWQLENYQTLKLEYFAY